MRDIPHSLHQALDYLRARLPLPEPRSQDERYTERAWELLYAAVGRYDRLRDLLAQRVLELERLEAELARLRQRQE